MENIFDRIKIARHEEIPDIAHEKFIQVYSQKFGEQNAEAFYEEQRGFFLNELTSGSYKELLKEASGISIYFAFLFLAINNLSLEKGLSTTCYLECKSVKVGEKVDEKTKRSTNIYERHAVISVTGYGEIVLRQRAGQIRSVDNPKVVYDCDSLRYGEREGKSFLEYEKAIPRPAGAKIIACYVRIVKADGTVDYFVLDTDEMVRLRQYSGKSNWGKANALYGTQQDCSDIDTGFLKSKTVKHAFKGYPKLSIGAGGAFESDKDTDPQPQSEPQPVEAQTNGVTVETSDDDPFNN
ncbi:MAG: serine/threonine protein kinase [Bacteroidales bacterium]|nr:serine/threonine protein kinase [Bacteroidales bacterium]